MSGGHQQTDRIRANVLVHARNKPFQSPRVIRGDVVGPFARVWCGQVQGLPHRGGEREQRDRPTTRAGAIRSQARRVSSLRTVEGVTCVTTPPRLPRSARRATVPLHEADTARAYREVVQIALEKADARRMPILHQE
jgi:hypothetical protein